MQVKKSFDDCLSSEELLNALNAGREDAFSFLFVKYYSNLFSYAYRILNDVEDAKECVQLTFCHLWDIRKGLVINDSIKSYLYRAVYNNSITILRHKKFLAKYEVKGLLDFYFTSIVQDPQAEMRINTSETKQVILDSIESLPKKCREIFVKCKIKGQSSAAVAQDLEISVKTVENQMTIAYKKLREKLKLSLNLFFSF
ncbi:MAG: hypothetical protein A2X18_05140 [Bacteroidetes bacterium GWF2_40_14]|nr:MAG: hypothetical protein A2X18_05140 [Bacteroidetes bacterium GWF2_40_14]